MKKIIFLIAFFLGLWSCGDSDDDTPTPTPDPEPAPTAAFSFSPESPEANEVVRFSNGSQNATAFVWSSDPAGFSSTAKDPEHRFPAAGTFTITLKATGPGGEATVSRSLTVRAAPVAPTVAFVFAPESPEAGESVQFTSTTTNADTFAWDFGDGQNSSIANPTHTYANAGTYTVRLTVGGPGGEATVSRSLTVRAAPVAPTVAFAFAPESPEAGESVQFTSTTTNADTFAWDFGDGQNSSTANPTHTYANAGTYTVRLTVRGSGGEATAEQSLTVRAAATGGSGDACQGENPCDLPPCYVTEVRTTATSSGVSSQVRSVFAYQVVAGVKVISQLTNTTGTPAGTITVISEYSYDERARNTRIVSRTQSPFLPQEIVVRNERTYDDCRLIREDNYDTDGNLTDYLTHSYDAAGRRIESTSYDAAGNFTGRTTFTDFDARNQHQLQEAFGADNALISSTRFVYQNCQPATTTTRNASGVIIFEQTGTFNAQGFLDRAVSTQTISEAGVTITTNAESLYSYQCD
ncbi:MAG: PKD domain-containing protein [Bernardetiaceae bacterium]